MPELQPPESGKKIYQRSTENVPYITQRMKREPSYFEGVTLERLTEYLGPTEKKFAWMHDPISHTVRSGDDHEVLTSTQCLLSVCGASKDAPREIVLMTVSHSGRYNLKSFGTEENADRTEIEEYVSSGITFGNEFTDWWMNKRLLDTHVRDRVSWKQVQGRKGIGELLKQAFQKAE